MLCTPNSKLLSTLINCNQFLYKLQLANTRATMPLPIHTKTIICKQINYIQANSIYKQIIEAKCIYVYTKFRNMKIEDEP